MNPLCKRLKPQTLHTVCLCKNLHKLVQNLARAICTSQGPESKNCCAKCSGRLPLYNIKRGTLGQDFCTNSPYTAFRTLYWEPFFQTARVQSCRNFRFLVVVFSSTLPEQTRHSDQHASIASFQLKGAGSTLHGSPCPFSWAHARTCVHKRF